MGQALIREWKSRRDNDDLVCLELKVDVVSLRMGWWGLDDTWESCGKERDVVGKDSCMCLSVRLRRRIRVMRCDCQWY